MSITKHTGELERWALDTDDVARLTGDRELERSARQELSTQFGLFLAGLVDRIADAVTERLAERLPAPRPVDELVDEPVMAERLGVSQPTLQRLRTAGGVPCVRLGRRVLYRPADVIAALSQQQKGGADA